MSRSGVQYARADVASYTEGAVVFGDADGELAQTAAMTNGQLLIGKTGLLPVLAILTGTANQVVVTNGAGTITLSTPQDLHTAATPQFARIGIGAVVFASAQAGLAGNWAERLGLYISHTLNPPATGSAASILVESTIVEAASGVHPLFASLLIDAPIITGGVATLTDAATLYITKAPSGTVTGQNYAIWVDAGLSRFDGDVRLPALTPSSFMYLDADGDLATTAAPTNGQLLIGSTGAIPVAAALTGTANQVVVTNGAGTITLSTPQSIATGSVVQFVGVGIGQSALSSLDVLVPSNTVGMQLRNASTAGVAIYGFRMGSTASTDNLAEVSATRTNSPSGGDVQIDFRNQRSGTLSTAWSILTSGILQSNGAQTLQTSSGTLTLGSAVSVSGGNLSMGNDRLISRDVNAGLTASITQTQGQGALTAEINEVATVTNVNDTVTLPTASAGLIITVINNGANTLKIFPALGDNLGAGVDISTTLAAGSNVTYVAYDATNWETY